jgi:hypothetical protein
MGTCLRKIVAKGPKKLPTNSTRILCRFPRGSELDYMVCHRHSERLVLRSLDEGGSEESPLQMRVDNRSDAPGRRILLFIPILGEVLQIWILLFYQVKLFLPCPAFEGFLSGNS